MSVIELLSVVDKIGLWLEVEVESTLCIQPTMVLTGIHMEKFSSPEWEEGLLGMAQKLLQ